MKFKIISLFLSLTMFIPSITACSFGKGTTETTLGEQQTSRATSDNSASQTYITTDKTTQTTITTKKPTVTTTTATTTAVQDLVNYETVSPEVFATGMKVNISKFNLQMDMCESLYKGNTKANASKLNEYLYAAHSSLAYLKT